MYLPRMMPSMSNTPTLTCGSSRSSTIARASAAVLTWRGSMHCSGSDRCPRVLPGSAVTVSILRRAVAFRLRMAVLALGERELLLGRQHQLVPADEREVQHAEHVPDAAP